MKVVGCVDACTISVESMYLTAYECEFVNVCWCQLTWAFLEDGRNTVILVLVSRHCHRTCIFLPGRCVSAAARWIQNTQNSKHLVSEASPAFSFTKVLRKSVQIIVQILIIRTF